MMDDRLQMRDRKPEAHRGAKWTILVVSGDHLCHSVNDIGVYIYIYI